MIEPEHIALILGLTWSNKECFHDSKKKKKETMVIQVQILPHQSAMQESMESMKYQNGYLKKKYRKVREKERGYVRQIYAEDRSGVGPTT